VGDDRLFRLLCQGAQEVGKLSGKSATRHDTVRTPALGGRQQFHIYVRGERHDHRPGFMPLGQVNHSQRGITDRQVHHDARDRVVGLAVVHAVEPVTQRFRVPGRSAHQAQRLCGRVDLGREDQVVAAVHNHASIIAPQPGQVAPGTYTHWSLF
jgi:hypothetical protein